MKLPSLSIIAVLFSLISFKTIAQEPFVGKIIFTVEMLDTNVQKIIDEREMTVYTNDTLSRIEILNDALGLQTTIKHMQMEKSYLLMTMMGKKIAIQTDMKDDTIAVESYTFKYKFFGRRKMNGFIMKKAIVYRSDIEERTIWYFKNINPNISNMYKGIKGLPADYYIGTVDGIVHYSVKSIESQSVAYDLFGIPSDYEKIKMDDFMERVQQPKD